MDDKKTLDGKKILMVEDDVFFSNMVAIKLSNLKCILKTASNGSDAFLALEKEKPDVIVLDLLLPGDMDGFEILTKVKSNSNLKNIPVVILSNLNDPKDVERGIKLGAFRYLTKALVSLDEIVDNIESALTSIKM